MNLLIRLKMQVTLKKLYSVFFMVWESIKLYQPLKLHKEVLNPAWGGMKFLAVLFLICIGAYFNSLSYDFVFDDVPLIVDNPFIKDFNFIGRVFKTGLFDLAYDNSKPNYYRPLQLISFMLDYRVWKLNPFGYHLSNVFLHFFNSCLIFYLIWLLFEDFFTAVFSSALFSVHPINITAVTYISGRADLLVSLFVLGTFFYAVLGAKFNKAKKTNFLFACVFFILALLSRENAVIAPLGVLLLGFLIKGARKYLAVLFSVLLLLVCLYLYIRAGLLNMPFTGQAFIPMPFYLKVVNFLYIIFSYLFLLAIPVNLCLMRAIKPILQIVDIRLYGTLISLLLFLAASYFKRKDKAVTFGAAWFLIFILPVFFIMGNFSPKITMAENWVYLSSVGFYIIIAHAVSPFKRYIKKIKYFSAVIFIVFGIYIALTVINNFNFKNRAVLSKYLLQVDAQNKEARKELAYIYLDSKQYGLAKEQIDLALKTACFDEDLYLLQGVYYEDIGNIDLAIASYEKILGVISRSARANNNLGGIYLNNSDFDKAEFFLKQAIEINPFLHQPYINLAKLNYKKKEIDRAVLFYKKALSLNPWLNEAAIALSEIYKGQGDAGGAIDILKRALILSGGDVPVLVMLGMLYGEQGLSDKAEYYFKEALKLDPKSVYAMFNLGVLYANNNHFDKAVTVWQSALNFSPDNKQIKDSVEKAKQLLLIQE